MGNRWYVTLGDQEVGPLSDTGLERMIQGGRIEGDALVRNGVAGEWTAAREVEPILAARPGRRRPGEEAIEAARRAKYQQQQLLQQQEPPRPPTPASRVALSSADQSLASQPPNLQPSAANGEARQTVTVTEDTLPAPDDLPLVQPPDSARPAPGAPILSPYVVAPGDAAGTAPTPKRRSLYFFVAIGAGLLALVAAICSAAWFSLGGGLSSNSSPPQPQPAAVDPQLAALRQQAEQLRRDLADAKQKLESPPQPSEAPPAEETPPAAPEPVAKSEPPAASDPSAKPVSESPPADLETQRKELAQMIAMERAVANERENVQRFAEQVDSNPDLEYESTLDSELLDCLDEATEEVAKLDAKQLATRREEVSAAREKRYKEAADLVNSVPSQVERIEIRQAILALGLASILGPADDAERLTKRIQDLSHAEPNIVNHLLGELSDAQLQRLIADERLPDNWPKRFDDTAIRDVVHKCAVRLAPAVFGLRQVERFAERFKDAKEAIDLAAMRKIDFLLLADGADEEGQITAAEVKSLVDAFGVFDIGDLAPLVDAIPSRRCLKMGSDPTSGFVAKVAQGKMQFETVRDEFEKARKAAGDAWPPDDPPHPLAGRWKGKENWEIEIDPRRDRIVFRRASPEATFEQRICKIGRDHVVAYERRKLPLERVATDPFRTEKYNDDDHVPGSDDPLPDEVIAFTYYSLEKGGQVLEMRRRIMPASFVQESVGREFWQLLSKPKKYREFRSAYRRVKE